MHWAVEVLVEVHLLRRSDELLGMDVPPRRRRLAWMFVPPRQRRLAWIMYLLVGEGWHGSCTSSLEKVGMDELVLSAFPLSESTTIKSSAAEDWEKTRVLHYIDGGPYYPKIPRRVFGPA